MKEDKQGNMGCRERNIGKRKCVSAVLLSVCLMFAAGCGGTNVDETYQMEIRTVDGYLDMRILYPTHASGVDELCVKEEAYWVWDLYKEKMIRIDDSELQARRSGAGDEAEAEEIPQMDIPFIPVTVKKGDSLWKISERYYGDGKYWGQIYEYNRSVIGEDPSLIFEGTELIFPYAD